jgi:60 kDa SS-A/Ro ribonucleoprotein
MMNYARGASRKRTPQSQPVLGKGQKRNLAGGYVFTVDPMMKIRRFLVLGCEGGSYYATERKMVRDNAETLIKTIQTNGVDVVNEIVEISANARAPKNDAALFALALCVTDGNEATKKAAYQAVPKVARTGTHLFQFVHFCEELGKGWGAGMRRAIASWYTEKDPDKLALQVVKYRTRQFDKNAWSHYDLLRLSHPKVSARSNIQKIFRFIKSGELGKLTKDSPLRLLHGFKKAQAAGSEEEILALVEKYRLPREAIPTEFLNKEQVLRALLPNMPVIATLRNLGNLSKNGVLVPMDESIDLIVDRLTDEDQIKYSMVHPIQVLAALTTYAQGHGARGRGEWEPVQPVIDALNDMFYKAFGNVEPTGKRYLLGIDVSGSMGWGEITGIPGLVPRKAAAAMALVTQAVERKVHIMAFAHEFRPINITAKMRLDTVCRALDGMSFGGTDCSLPMQYALQKKIPVDVFCVYTDNETWFGAIHPFQALKEYRKQMGIPAKLAVVAMTATDFTIADPSDAGMVDCVGFDTATPEIISRFARDEL